MLLGLLARSSSPRYCRGGLAYLLAPASLDPTKVGFKHSGRLCRSSPNIK